MEELKIFFGTLKPFSLYDGGSGDIFKARTNGTATVTEESESRKPEPETALAGSVRYANSVANSVQARYVAGSNRTGYEICNRKVRIVESLDTDGKLGIESISEKDGGTYLANTMYSYVIDRNGKVWSDNYSTTVGRINTTRHGYYFYEVFLRDQTFGTAEGGSFLFDSETELSDFDGDWANSGHCTLTYDRGRSATMTITKGLDPYMCKTLDRPVPRSKATHIALTVASAGSGGRSQLFIYDLKTKEFNAGQMIDFELSCDGKPHTYVLDISGILCDDLAGVRIDAGKLTGETYTVSDVRAVTVGDSIRAAGEKTLDVYPDKLHQSFRLLAQKDYIPVKEFGMVWEVPEDRVEEILIRDGAGLHADTATDPETVEFAAFKIKDAGICAVIVPSDGSTLKTEITRANGLYTVKQVASGCLDLLPGESCTFGHRIFTDAGNDIYAADKEARKEREPLAPENFRVGERSNGARIIGYDALKGYYVTTVDGTGWPPVFKQGHRNDYFISDITVTGDAEDRNIYMCVTSYPGTLECAVLLDEHDVQVPVPMQVVKNFDCEKEEKVYDPEDRAYSNSIFPLVIGRGERVAFSDVHLYVNWGVYELKQLSAIQFFVSYYHLSTGCSESNCVSFYGVYGKDGFLLPDFRGHSGIRWDTDPQFTSVGTPKAVSYVDNEGSLVMNEYLGSDISSSGPVYADLEYSFIADSGAFKYSIRHTEFPQTDENRTYMVLKLDFLKDLTLDDVRKQFSLLSQDSRGQYFAELSYMDPSGTRRHEYLETVDRGDDYYVLNAAKGWYAYYHSDRPVPERVNGEHDPMNYAVIIRKTEAVIGGKPWKGNLILRDSFGGNMNYSALSLDLGRTEFKAGDSIYLEFLMLPWANRVLSSDSNILTVFEDSVERPLRVYAARIGTPVNEPYIARVRCENELAEFTLTGGRNRNVVRVDGFKSICRPVVRLIDEAGNAHIHKTNVAPYDGYGVHLEKDGTYSYSFVYETDDPDNKYTFRVSVT